MAEANVETLRRGYAALNRGELSEVISLIDDDIVWDPGDLSPDGQPNSRGRAGFEAFVRSWIDAFDDFRVEPYDVIEEGQFLIALVRQSGRGRVSGAAIEVEIAHVWTIDDGRAVRLESYRNRQAALDAVRGKGSPGAAAGS
jgi:uncharacterized protein